MNFAITEIEGEADDFAASLNAMLDAAALELDKPFIETPLHLRADAGDGALIGGLAACTMQGWLFVRYLVVAEGRRGSGLGRAMMLRAEEIARDRGLVGVYLDTFDFQAPRFYASMGYIECGRLPAAGGAPQRIWFAKTFQTSE
ncbi:acetyltransferase (GNAT) family protein [Hoeflea marina]|uniref:Acetyltransferase (GNAT) family protein n=1 Tax=Hoeflea marina TaxID=274592 RepID=A0A317PG35_9HYPH|nr:GNAT family N-acetyltransferase [Hoeflea marina]PWV98984.1 acetyltransferase (GNAT) family protein [Hoeflea marina]